MRAIFPFLLIIEVGFLVVASFMGLIIDKGPSGTDHVLMGILTAVYTMFLHCLVMFYLIGSGKDVKNATEDYPDLWEEFILKSKKVRRMCFPYSAASVIMILLAAFAGVWVHGQLIVEAYQRLPSGTDVEAKDIVLPVRDFAFWWIHLAVLAVALVINIPTFFIERKAIFENGKLIHELNDRLLARIYPAEGPAIEEGESASSGEST